MSRGRTCTICTGENVSQVNALLASGIKLKDIAAQIPGLSPYALSRHKRNCLAPASDAPTGDGVDIETQLQLLTQRADDLYVSSGAALDLRGQSAALAASLRALEFKLKHQERMDEQAEKEKDDALTGPDSILTIGALDALIAKADADPRNRPIFLIRCALQGAPEKNFPALAKATLNFIKQYRPPEPLKAMPETAPAPATTQAPPPAPAPVEETAFLQCPHCSSRAVSVTNGNLRCGTCGEQQPLPAGIRLKAEFPNHWIQKEVTA